MLRRRLGRVNRKVGSFLEYREKLEKLTAEQGGRLTLEKGDDPKELRRALKATATAVKPACAVPVPRQGGVAQLLPGRPAGTTPGSTSES
jgi:hypothetical protein